MKIIVILIIIDLVMMIKYLGGYGDDYTYDNPGSDLFTCLNDYTCYLVNDFFLILGSGILGNGEYKFLSYDSSFYSLTLNGDFVFTIDTSSIYDNENLKVDLCIQTNCFLIF
jgi:hypothetical protein